MKEPKLMKIQTNPINPVLAVFALACFALIHNALAVSPPPDGGYAGGNTAEGQKALFSRTTGGFNTAVGWLSLDSLTTGSYNTGVGAGTLLLNTGDENTATGVAALLLNTTGGGNTANGAFALFSNITGSFNTANGAFALFSNTAGNGNIATGIDALHYNTIGNGNTANGGQALLSNTTGNGNIALGFNAGLNLTTGDNNIDIGNVGVAGESGTIRIGDSQTATYIAGIFGQAIDPNYLLVGVDANGKLGTTTSSRRFKHDIKPMDRSSEAILAFKPVTFHYNSDAKNTPCFGLIAEEVAEVNPHLVVRDKNGEVLSVRYDAVNAMLLNEFLKEHRTVQELKSTMQKQQNDFQSKLAEQQKRIEALTMGLQKVSAQIELRKPSAQTVVNNH
jgi:hypothetical protein